MAKNLIDNSLDPLFVSLEAAKGNTEEIQKLIKKANDLAATWTDLEFMKYSEDLVEFMNKARS